MSRRLASSRLSWSPSASFGCPHYRSCCGCCLAPSDLYHWSHISDASDSRRTLIHKYVVFVLTARAHPGAPTTCNSSTDSLAKLRRSRSDGVPDTRRCAKQRARWRTGSLGRVAGLSPLDVFVIHLLLQGRRQQRPLEDVRARWRKAPRPDLRGWWCRTAAGQLHLAGVSLRNIHLGRWRSSHGCSQCLLSRSACNGAYMASMNFAGSLVVRGLAEPEAAAMATPAAQPQPAVALAALLRTAP